MDLSRHIEVFSPDAVKYPIHIIGVGATGSFVAMELARMGCPVLNLYDFDDVEIHNIPNQYYDNNDLGKLKAEALSEKLKLINPNIVVNVHTSAVLPAEDEELPDETIFFAPKYIATVYLLQPVGVSPETDVSHVNV